MDEETKQETQELINTLKNKDIAEEIKTVQAQSPVQQLRESLFNFFDSRLKAIEKEDDFLRVVREALIAKVETDEMSTAQLMQLFNQIKNQSSKSLEVLLNAFKPTEGDSTIMGSSSHPDTDRAIEEFNNLSPDQKDNLNKIANLLEIMKQSSE